MADWTDKLGGKFIVIDGPDGAGKSTQLKLLGEFLGGRGVEILQTRDPGGTPIGDKIRAILLDNSHGEMSVACETMLYMASRAQLAAEVIRPAMQRGACVLCDRYISATIAYQGAGGADVEAIRSAGRLAVGGLWPNLTVVLDIDAEQGLRRVGQPAGHDRMEAKGLKFHRKVREMFLRQAKDAPESFAVVDAAGAVEQVQQKLRSVLESHGWAS